MQNRYDFVYLFDVKDGNPNGDPDAGNLPRNDAETGQGLVTDVCIKRKVRNYVGLVHGEQPPYEIYIKEKAVLNNQHGRAWEKVLPETKKADRKKLPKDQEKARELTQWMCHNFFDIRTFGAVMTTGGNCGQVRGPVQFGMGRSIDPIVTAEHAVTRCASVSPMDNYTRRIQTWSAEEERCRPSSTVRSGHVSRRNAQRQYSARRTVLWKTAASNGSRFDRRTAGAYRANCRPAAFIDFRWNHSPSHP